MLAKSLEKTLQTWMSHNQIDRSRRRILLTQFFFGLVLIMLILTFVIIFVGEDTTDNNQIAICNRFMGTTCEWSAFISTFIFLVFFFVFFAWIKMHLHHYFGFLPRHFKRWGQHQLMLLKWMSFFKTSSYTIFYATHYNDLKSVKRYVTDGGDINVFIPNLGTPLHVACRLGHFRLARWLIKNGARLDLKCGEDTLFSLIFKDVFHMFSEHHEDKETNDIYGSTLQNGQIVRYGRKFLRFALLMHTLVDHLKDVNQTILHKGIHIPLLHYFIQEAFAPKWVDQEELFKSLSLKIIQKQSPIDLLHQSRSGKNVFELLEFYEIPTKHSRQYANAKTAIYAEEIRSALNQKLLEQTTIPAIAQGNPRRL